jgi:hypothetical protein
VKTSFHDFVFVTQLLPFLETDMEINPASAAPMTRGAASLDHVRQQ